MPDNIYIMADGTALIEVFTSNGQVVWQEFLCEPEAVDYPTRDHVEDGA